MSYILHLVDDEKVINRTVDFFERALPGRNVFLCFCKKNEDGSYNPKYVSPCNVVYFYDESVDVPEFTVSEVTKVIIHALFDYKVSFINKYIPFGVPVCWFVWGYDLYGQILDGMGYHLYPLRNSKITFREWLNNRAKGLINYKSKQAQYFCTFISERVTSVGCCDGDYELMRHYHIIRDIPRVDYYYYPIEDVLGDLFGKSISSDADLIMCGNSAAEANNHEYMLRRLQSLGVTTSKIVMPLSYCGTPEYIKKVCDCGSSLFGDRFVPVTTFLHLDEYNKLFLRAGLCVYASWRQMAVGNILVALYLGAKVYLSKHNPWLKDALNLGLKVYVFENANSQSFTESITSKYKDSNRRVIESSFSSENLTRLILEQFGE